MRWKERRAGVEKRKKKRGHRVWHCSSAERRLCRALGQVRSVPSVPCGRAATSPQRTAAPQHRAVSRNGESVTAAHGQRCLPPEVGRHSGCRLGSEPPFDLPARCCVPAHSALDSKASARETDAPASPSSTPSKSKPATAMAVLCDAATSMAPSCLSVLSCPALIIDPTLL